MGVDVGSFGYGEFGSFYLMHSIVSSIIFIGFIVVLGVILYCVFKGALQWNKNNNSPKLTVEAKVIGKRLDVSHHRHTGVNQTDHHYSSSTTYYITFELSSLERIEFHVKDSDYGMLAEGDRGRLTYQGTRYLGFDRIM